MSEEIRALEVIKDVILTKIDHITDEELKKHYQETLEEIQKEIDEIKNNRDSKK